MAKHASLASAKHAAAQPLNEMSANDMAKSFRAAATGGGGKPSADGAGAKTQSVLGLADALGPTPGTAVAGHVRSGSSAGHSRRMEEEESREVELAAEPSLGSFRSFKVKWRRQRAEEDGEGEAAAGLDSYSSDDDEHGDVTLPEPSMAKGAAVHGASPMPRDRSPTRVRFGKAPSPSFSSAPQGVEAEETRGGGEGGGGGAASTSFVRRSALKWRAFKSRRGGAVDSHANGAKTDPALARVFAGVFGAAAPTLRALDLSCHGWQWQEAAAFASVLPQLTYCSRLRLGGNRIGTRGANALAGALRGNLTIRLTSLYLDHCELPDEGSAFVLAALQENDMLSELNLDGNSCGRTACTELCKALKCNVSLETLGLYRCGVDEEGAKLIAEGLDENVSLLNLLMSDNGIGDAGGEALAGALILNQSLERLWVAGNGMSREAIRVLSEACDTHDPTAKYGKHGTVYSEASRQLYQSKFGERQRPVELLCE